jgi:hypothetical protein
VRLTDSMIVERSRRALPYWSTVFFSWDLLI